MAYQETLPETLTDEDVAEFIDLARSANVHFDITNDRLHMRMVNPDWAMWSPIRHLLDEIGQERIEAFVRRETTAQQSVDRWNHASAVRLYTAVEAMRR